MACQLRSPDTSAASASTAAVDAQKAQKKKEAAEARKRKLEESKNDPINRARVWLKNLNSDSSACDSLVDQLQSQADMPAAPKAEFVQARRASQHLHTEACVKSLRVALQQMQYYATSYIKG